MIYEAVLLFGIAFAVGFVLLAAMRWSYPLQSNQRALLQAALFIAIGAYFVACWSRTGQTLALKAWRLKVVDDNDRPPRSGRAVARYLLACHLWLPALALGALLHSSIGSMLALSAIGFALSLIPALLDGQHRLLHDLLTGTRVVRVPSRQIAIK